MKQITFNEKLNYPDPHLSDFPTEKHFIAWNISNYFGESYANWVRWIRDSYLWNGQIVYEFNRIKSLDFSKQEKVKLLMKKLYPHG